MAELNPLSQQGSDIFEWTSRSTEETERVGETLGRCLAAGDVVALIGELGAGKTTLVRGLARGLGIDPTLVKSPTFVLVRRYPGPIPLVHVDGYRFEHSGEVLWEDVEWIAAARAVTVLEWADRCAESLPEDYLEVQLVHKTTHQRTIRVLEHGPRSHQVLTNLASTVHSPQSTLHREAQ